MRWTARVVMRMKRMKRMKRLSFGVHCESGTVFFGSQFKSLGA
jgi:hypothetical protein